MTKRPSSLGIFAVAVGVLLVGVGLVAWTSVEPEPPQQPPEPPDPGLEEVVARAWWHRPQLSEDLDLEEDQSRAMDAILREHLQWQTGHQTRRRDLQAAWRQALEANELEAAQLALTELVESVAEGQRRQGELKLAILDLLDESQHERLIADHPRLLLRSWIPSERSGAAGRGRTRDRR